MLFWFALGLLTLLLAFGALGRDIGSILLVVALVAVIFTFRKTS